MTVDEIPEAVALWLCDEIFAESHLHWYTASGMICRGCRHFSGGRRASDACMRSRGILFVSC